MTGWNPLPHDDYSEEAETSEPRDTLIFHLIFHLISSLLPCSRREIR